MNRTIWLALLALAAPAWAQDAATETPATPEATPSEEAAAPAEPAGAGEAATDEAASDETPTETSAEDGVEAVPTEAIEEPAEVPSGEDIELPEAEELEYTSEEWTEQFEAAEALGESAKERLAEVYPCDVWQTPGQPRHQGWRQLRPSFASVQRCHCHGLGRTRKRWGFVAIARAKKYH